MCVFYLFLPVKVFVKREAPWSAICVLVSFFSPFFFFFFLVVAVFIYTLPLMVFV